MSANEELFGVCYRSGAPDIADYDEAIVALRHAREALLDGDNFGCRVCEDSGHGANMCHHNPLLLARKWAAATDVWQCWHCGFVATNAEEAREHFGLHEAELPACQIAARLEGQKYFESFTALHRALDSMEPALTGAQWKHITIALMEVGAKYGTAT